jgi:hypothetical protein
MLNTMVKLIFEFGLSGKIFIFCIKMKFFKQMSNSKNSYQIQNQHSQKRLFDTHHAYKIQKFHFLCIDTKTTLIQGNSNFDISIGVSFRAIHVC